MMKKKIMIMAMAGLIAAGSAEAAFAAEKQTDDRIMQLIQSIKDYIAGQIKDEQKPENDAVILPEAQNSRAQQVINLTNKERNKAGLPDLKASSQLSRLAQLKAEDMARNGYFSHTSPTYGSAFDMMKSQGISYRSAGENLAKGQPSAQAAMKGWMNSSSHRENILSSKYSEIGVGIAENGRGTIYWVQIFKG